MRSNFSKYSIDKLDIYSYRAEVVYGKQMNYANKLPITLLENSDMILKLNDLSDIFESIDICSWHGDIDSFSNLI